jgi:hypothetical protein
MAATVAQPTRRTARAGAGGAVTGRRYAAGPAARAQFFGHHVTRSRHLQRHRGERGEHVGRVEQCARREHAGPRRPPVEDPGDRLDDDRRGHRVDVLPRGGDPPLTRRGAHAHVDGEPLAGATGVVDGHRGRRGRVAKVLQRPGREVGAHRLDLQVRGDRDDLGERQRHDVLRAERRGEHPGPGGRRGFQRHEPAAVDDEPRCGVAPPGHPGALGGPPPIERDRDRDLLGRFPGERSGGEEIGQPAVERGRGHDRDPGCLRRRCESAVQGRGGRLLGGDVQVGDARTDGGSRERSGRVEERPGGVDHRVGPGQDGRERDRVVQRDRPLREIGVPRAQRGELDRVAAGQDGQQAAPDQLRGDEPPRVSVRAVDDDLVHARHRVRAPPPSRASDPTLCVQFRTCTAW